MLDGIKFDIGVHLFIDILIAIVIKYTFIRI